MKATKTTASSVDKTQSVRQAQNMRSLKIFIFLTQMKIYCRLIDVSFNDFCDYAFGLNWQRKAMHTLPELWNKKHPQNSPIMSLDTFLDLMMDNIDAYKIHIDFI